MNENATQSGDWDFIVAPAGATVNVMNTHKTGMRTVLAAAAVGALVLGSAGGVVADPGKAKGPKAKSGYVKVTKVDIRKHKKINLDDVYGDLKLRVKVRDTTGVTPDAATDPGVTLALFESKRSMAPIAGIDSVVAKYDGMASKGKKSKKWITYKFTVAKDLLAPVESAIDAGTDGFKGYLCISDIETDATEQNRQTMRRLNTDPDKKTLRECVKVYDMTDADESVPVTPES